MELPVCWDGNFFPRRVIERHCFESLRACGRIAGVLKFPVAVEELAPWGFKTKFAIGSFLARKWHRSGARSFLVDTKNGLVLPIGLLAMEKSAENKKR